MRGSHSHLPGNWFYLTEPLSVFCSEYHITDIVASDTTTKSVYTVNRPNVDTKFISSKAFDELIESHSNSFLHERKKFAFRIVGKSKVGKLHFERQDIEKDGNIIDTLLCFNDTKNTEEIDFDVLFNSFYFRPVIVDTIHGSNLSDEQINSIIKISKELNNEDIVPDFYFPECTKFKVVLNGGEDLKYEFENKGNTVIITCIFVYHPEGHNQQLIYYEYIFPVNWNNIEIVIREE